MAASLKIYESYIGLRGQQRVGLVDSVGRVHHYDLEEYMSLEAQRRAVEMNGIPETDVQFLARMVLLTRESGQISSRDAQKLANLANFGPGPQPTTMPEERRSADRPLGPDGAADLVRG